MHKIIKKYRYLVRKHDNMYKYTVSPGNSSTYVLSVDNHQDIVPAITAFCKRTGIISGEIRGLGAVSKAVIRYYSPVTKKYEDHVFAEQMEIASLTGNVSMKDGEVYLHIHAVFGRNDCSCIGGHLLDATISGACELFIEDLEVKAGRKYDEETGLNLYEF